MPTHTPPTTSLGMSHPLPGTGQPVFSTGVQQPTPTMSGCPSPVQHNTPMAPPPWEAHPETQHPQMHQLQNQLQWLQRTQHTQQQLLQEQQQASSPIPPQTSPLPDLNEESILGPSQRGGGFLGILAHLVSVRASRIT